MVVGAAVPEVAVVAQVAVVVAAVGNDHGSHDCGAEGGAAVCRDFNDHRSRHGRLF